MSYYIDVGQSDEVVSQGGISSNRNVVHDAQSDSPSHPGSDRNMDEVNSNMGSAQGHGHSGNNSPKVSIA